MHVALVILLLLSATALSSLITRAIRVPLPLLQIAMGVLIDLAGLPLRLEPDVFMLLFIPPLLFADAYVMPMRAFRRLRGVILALALGLVLFSTLAGGWFIHWLEPGVPLAACFALAAVLSPTDAVAVGSILEGSRAPRRFLHILSGEALLNDASGLVCFRFAALATMSGGFSLLGASGTFLGMVAGGVGVGIVVGWLASRLTSILARRAPDAPAAHVTLVAMLPFAAYLGAERLGGSGILAAVAAGITLNRAGGGGGFAQLRLNHQVVWSMIGFLFNGVIFLLLGLQLPQIVARAMDLARADRLPAWQLPVTVLLTTLALIALRLVWLRLSLAVRWTHARLRRRQAVQPSWRGSLAIAVAGVRGAITLAAVLSLPAASQDTRGFPHRDLLIAIAAGVIICSMLLAAMLLPLLVRNLALPEPDTLEQEIAAARIAMARAALEVTGQFRDRVATDDDAAALVADTVGGEHQRRLERLEADEANDKRARAINLHRRETALRLRALRAQRAELSRLLRAERIDDEGSRRLQHELDMEEAALLGSAEALAKL
ncbi:Na+/H+ antiporter [Lichenicoccus sp.]|uniref:Na+/H+ antiporter n=1 Tax=Lichenicoccus sp. TaxID=2781899 RepID=UPI003D0CA48A